MLTYFYKKNSHSTPPFFDMLPTLNKQNRVFFFNWKWVCTSFALLIFDKRIPKLSIRRVPTGLSNWGFSTRPKFVIDISKIARYFRPWVEQVEFLYGQFLVLVFVQYGKEQVFDVLIRDILLPAIHSSVWFIDLKYWERNKT